MSENEEILTKFINYNDFHRQNGELIMTMKLATKESLNRVISEILQENKLLKHKLDYFKLMADRDCNEEFEL